MHTEGHGREKQNIFLVTGNIMGSGVFMLLANLAAYGWISLIGWLITTAGASSGSCPSPD